MANLVLAALLVSLRISAGQLPIDNGVISAPQIDCLSNRFTINFVTKNAFGGHAFVRGHYGSPDCHKDFVTNQQSGGTITVEFEPCGIRRTRNANPRGMIMSATIVLSFHRTFITQIDRAYNIQCFYLEEEKQVTNTLGISELPTASMDMPSVDVPDCRYEVLKDGGAGGPVTAAQIGDKVYHKWTCVYPIPEMYCMIIHSCTVYDGVSSTYEVIDDQGCSKDTLILEDVAYIGDLEAGTESNVFKFADQPHVYFTCQVRLMLKGEDGQSVCPKPRCGLPQSVLRHKRQAGSRQLDFDLNAPPMLVAALDDKLRDVREKKPLRLHNSTQLHRHRGFVPAFLAPRSPAEGVCLSDAGFGILASAALLSCLATVLLLFVYCVRNRSVIMKL